MPLGLREAFPEFAGALVEEALNRARRVLGTSDACALLAAADALTAVAIDFGWPSVDPDLIVAVAAAQAGVSPAEARRQIFLFATRDPRVIELPPRFAMEFHLNLLARFADIAGATLWTGGDSTRIECILSAGSAQVTRRTRAVARMTLSPDAEHDRARGLICGVRVLRWQRPCAALVIRRSAGDQLAVALARETATALAPILERDMLLDRNIRRERTLVEATEKRLARIGYDVHDGPLQDATVVQTSIQLIRRALKAQLDTGAGALVDERLADLEGYATELTTSLRELATTLEPKHVLELPFPLVLRQEVEAFARRTGIAAGFDVSGNAPELTASQRLALYRVLQEALTNVREHSGATVVHVSIDARRSSTELRVIDNGTGFDVTRVLIDRARRGRLGLVGIGERVRMLGGTLDIVSRPENYTELSVSLPVWRPATTVAAVDSVV